MKDRQKKLDDLLTRMRAIQDEHKGKAMPKEKADEFEKLAVEAKALQDELDREKALQKLEAEKGERDKAAKVVPDPTNPDPTGGAKEEKPVGYLRLGDYVVAQQGIQDFLKAGKPRPGGLLARITARSLIRPRKGGEILVPLDAAAVKQVKSVPTIGAGVIEPTLVPDIVRVTEHDRLVLRDILDVSRTDRDSIKYTRIVSYTRAASAVARSARKPEAALALDAVNEPVRTIAVWLPVEDQQLDDLPALAGIINGELLYDVNKHVEELVCYGSGAGEEFRGILVDPDVLAARSVNFGVANGDTLIDVVRRGITDVTRAGYEPNGVLVDPLDWETVVLQKGNDNRYVWVVVTDGATQRLWGVAVVETVAMTDFQGVATEQRHLLIGDFLRGATLWDRQDASVSVGWINEQYIQNQRTILAELRAVFGVKRPGAFRKFQTQEASAS